MIITQNVNKFYGHFQALKNVSFAAKQGEIVGFLGQNGAGKTTLMRILTGFFLPTSGEVTVANEDVVRSPLKALKKIGYLPENPPLYQYLTVSQYLRFVAELRDIPSASIKVQMDKVLDSCDLRDVQNQVIGELSKGYRQRVGIAQAVIHNPSVLILDEPTSGLDPIQSEGVRKLIKNFGHEHTVILSTHILSEIEHLASRVLIIKSGKIIADDSMEKIVLGNKNLEEAFIRLVKHE